MPRGYRLFIIAALGFVALYSFGLGYYHATLNYPQEQRYQPYREAAAKISDIDPAISRPAGAKPFEYRTPCDEPKGKGESELCAQWRAAKAGEDSAFWAKWGFWIGVIGSSFLVWQIILTRQAVEDTTKATKAMKKANRIAREANIRERRPWLKVGYIAIDDMMSIAPKVTIDIVNTGRSTAVMISSHVEVCICARLPMTRPYQGKKGNSPFRDIKDIEAGTSASATEPIEAFFEKMPAIKKGVLKLYIMGWVQYDDDDIPRRTMFCRIYDPKTRKLIPTNDPDYEVQH